MTCKFPIIQFTVKVCAWDVTQQPPAKLFPHSQTSNKRSLHCKAYCALIPYVGQSAGYEWGSDTSFLFTFMGRESFSTVNRTGRLHSIQIGLCGTFADIVWVCSQVTCGSNTPLQP